MNLYSKRKISFTFLLLIIISVQLAIVTTSCNNNPFSGKSEGVSTNEDSISFEEGELILKEIPDKEGMSIKGFVHCNGEGISNVVVSDGFELTTTDSNGIYYLPSKKVNAYVFISVPGNYEVPEINKLPQFFKRLSGGDAVEQKDFSLIKVNNDQHVLITMADMHLANRNDDLLQFRTKFLPDVNASIEHYKAEGKKVYGLTLGDMSWDSYWESNNFALPDYLAEMRKINCTVFNVMGNHDNDIHNSGDFQTAEPYRKTVGPNYYSFNLGKAHYVVLDNIEYINTGGTEAKSGKGNYLEVIVDNQMEWLKKDLASINDKSLPLFIAMHCPLYDNPEVEKNGQIKSIPSLVNGDELIAALGDFSDVHILSGHTHINYTVEGSASLMEHNTAAICATWWWTGKSGYSGNHICIDGSPGGYGVWEINEDQLKWRYKGINKDQNYQFRTYDLNKLRITAEEFAPNLSEESLAKYTGEYANLNEKNEVLINVWGYDPDWKIQVTEEGKDLDVTRVSAMDPLFIISYMVKRLNEGKRPSFSSSTRQTAHMFKVTASGPATTLQINVTDRFGNLYTETMKRPKKFTYLMN